MQANAKQILDGYYFPNIVRLTNEVVVNYRICSKSKYNRQPTKREIHITPIPSSGDEMLHIGIFSTDNRYFFICVFFQIFSAPTYTAMHNHRIKGPRNTIDEYL